MLEDITYAMRDGHDGYGRFHHACFQPTLDLLAAHGVATWLEDGLYIYRLASIAGRDYRASYNGRPYRLAAEDARPVSYAISALALLKRGMDGQQRRAFARAFLA